MVRSPIAFSSLLRPRARRRRGGRMPQKTGRRSRRVGLGVSHHQNDLLRKRSRDGSSVQAYAYGVPGDCLRRADASFTPIHEV